MSPPGRTIYRAGRLFCAQAIRMVRPVFFSAPSASTTMSQPPARGALIAVSHARVFPVTSPHGEDAISCVTAALRFVITPRPGHDSQDRGGRAADQVGPEQRR